VALHTRTALVPGLIDRIKKDHPYDVPCILAFSVKVANPDYVAWVEAETREAA
jgi:periplasmic divalent cation tolerance protein